jgi:hypothetical protein
MHGKRFLTIACAVGILVSGACFLPPPHQTPTPPPPLRVDLHGSQGIRVVVTNVAEAHHIDPDELGRWIVLEINRHKDSGTPKARLGGDPIPNEAVFQISVLKELATAETDANSYGYSKWSWTMNIDATLTAPDGSTVWQLSNRKYQYRDSLRLLNGEDVWRTRTVRDLIHFEIVPSLVKQMLFGTQ